MDNRVIEQTPSTCSNRLYKVLISIHYLTLWLFGLHPFCKSHLIHGLYILLWCCEIAVATYFAIIYDIFGDENSLNGLVSTILYMAHIGGHLAILAESWKMQKYRAPLYDQYFKLKACLEQDLQIRVKHNISSIRICKVIIIFGLLLTTCHGIIMWTTFQTKSAATLLYWRSLPSFLALQFKSLEFFISIALINYYIIVIRRNINDMGERNLMQVFKTSAKPKKSRLILVLSQQQEWEDERQIRVLKASYNEVYATFQLLNKGYGWSLLAATAVYFVDFVCNTYWILLAVISQGRDYYALLQNAAFALMAFILLSILCWLCEESFYQSRYIGCLISKLVKPLGNKHYNDLVSEFSVQTLHQRFIITAKEFFSLNLNLLGSMVAAIVTYLVILIQFMFTEKSNNESKLTTKVALSSIATTPISTTDLTLTTPTMTLLRNVSNSLANVVLTTMESPRVLSNETLTTN